MAASKQAMVVKNALKENRCLWGEKKEPERGRSYRLRLDELSVYKLGLIHCTTREAAAVIGCSEATIIDRFLPVLQRGWEDGQASLKRKMHAKALDGQGDTSLLIWLSKQRCSYRDRAADETQSNATINININAIPI